MARFVARRLVGMAIVLFAVSILVFIIFNVIPGGDPAQRICGKNCNHQLLVQINKDFGFNDPLPADLPDARNYLEAALEISSSEAEAIVRYRRERGDFKNLEDLKKVSSLDSAKIESKKDRLFGVKSCAAAE